jgi:hypothetical protein
MYFVMCFCCVLVYEKRRMRLGALTEVADAKPFPIAGGFGLCRNTEGERCWMDVSRREGVSLV